MHTPYRYSVFGLNILSEFNIPELAEADFSEPDVRIRYGSNPAELEQPSGKGVLYSAKKNDFLFRLETVGSFRVQDGRLVTVERLNNSTQEEFRLFLLGSAFGALAHQRDLFPCHGSTVVKDEKAYVIAGISGSGKSSLAATFVKRGYRLLADDISVIRAGKDSTRVFPGIPHLKLWEDVMKKLDIDTGASPKIRPGILKYRKAADKGYVAEPKTLGGILVLSTKNTPGFEAVEAKGVEKFDLLKNNTYRYRYLEGLEKVSEHFRMVSDIAAGNKVYKVRRPVAPLLLEELADFCEQRIFHRKSDPTSE